MGDLVLSTTQKLEASDSPMAPYLNLIQEMSMEQKLALIAFLINTMQHEEKKTSSEKADKTEVVAETEEFSPRVMRFKRGNPWYATDEEVDKLRYEYLMEKYKSPQRLSMPTVS